jgi:hypothetical protein
MSPNHLAHGCHLAVYYFPNYHLDPRNEQWHGQGWTEWELVKLARPRFEGHQQPKLPLWGFEDESLPSVMEKKIEAAAGHGINSWIFDWYWYEDGPYLNGCLEKGFLGASNNTHLSFSLMWANHDWFDIHPMKYRTTPALLAPGRFSPEAFERATDHIVKTYFSHPSYWTIEGKAYFSIYELDKLLESLGGVEGTRRAFTRFEEKARGVGLEGIHFNAVIWKIPVLPGEQATANPNQILTDLGFSSVTSYVWIHHDWTTEFPTSSYPAMAQRAVAQWNKLASENTFPYYPNVTMGWDPSPRTCQSDHYDNLGYPYGFILEGNSPTAFRSALESAKTYLMTRPIEHRILTLNAWNEWTEGSYLEPDTIHKFAYLEAIREVFG